MAHVVITGANRGVGLELARQFAARGDQVTAVCRSVSDSLKALDVEIVDGVDMTDDASVARLAAALKGRAVDILVNNAGVFLDRNDLEHADLDAIATEFDVNALGPLRVSRALLPMMGEGGKIAIVSSIRGSLDDTASGGSYGYRMSKAAANMAGRTLSVEFAPRGIAVILLHPGYVATDMTSHQGPVPTHKAAAGIIDRIDALDMEMTGTFWHAEGRHLPW